MKTRLSLVGYRRGRAWRMAWAVGVGGVGTIYLLNLALHTPLLLALYCESECTTMSWRSPVPPENRITINHIRKQVLGPAQGRVVEPITPAELDDPPWISLGAWSYVESAIRIIFKHRRGGVFVEVGAGPGVFKSHTAWLEARRGWSGLLVEPRPDAYTQLRRRRKAAAAQACVSDISFSKKEELWSPGVTGRLTQHYRNIALARSTLMAYVDEQDKEGSTITPVQCFTLNALIWAAVGQRRPVDLLVLDTAGGEYKILDTLERLSVSVMVVRYNTKVDRMLIINSVKRFDLVHQPSDDLDADGLLFFMKKVNKRKTQEETGVSDV